MNAVEQLIPLTEPDRKILISQRNRSLVYALGGIFGAVALLALLLVFQTLYCLVALPFFSLLSILGAITSLLEFFSLRKDLSQGQKQLFSAPIEEQNMDVKRRQSSRGVEGAASYTFWVKANGRKFTVTEDQYYQFKKGDQIEAEVAPRSNTVFRIVKLDR